MPRTSVNSGNSRAKDADREIDTSRHERRKLFGSKGCLESASSRHRGRPIETADAWIAAAAVQYQIPLLTGDRNFSAVAVEGLKVILFEMK
ncbi:PIN domain-containing protein [bacterium]|nr:PIN domain-containing protein [bacterium]